MFLLRQSVRFTKGVIRAALPIATLETSSDLHSLLRKIDPSAFREEIEAEARAQLSRIVARVRSLCADSASETAGGASDALRQKLTQLMAALERAQQIETASVRAFWAAFQREVHPAYESLAAWLRSSALPAPSFRPTNYARSLFHIGSALLALLVLVLAPWPGFPTLLAGVLCGTAWSLEVARRRSPRANDRLMRFFGAVAHAHERHRVNSSTWYMTALLLLSSLVEPAVSAIAVAVLGFGDPAAALVGRRFGRIRLRAGRSLEGSCGFVAAASLVAFVVASVLLPGTFAVHLIIALVAGVTGAVVEMFSTSVDDNLTIPLAVAASVRATLALISYL